MNADDLTRVAYHAGETKAVLYFLAILAISGWCVAAYMAILYWMLKPRAKREHRENLALREQAMRLNNHANRLQAELNELTTLRSDADFLKEQYKELDIKHDLLKVTHDGLVIQAKRYHDERNKSDEQLRKQNKIVEELTASGQEALKLIEHIDVPILKQQVK